MIGNYANVWNESHARTYIVHTWGEYVLYSWYNAALDE